MTYFSTAIYYVNNFALLYAIVAALFVLSFINMNLYYVVLAFSTGFMIISRWANNQGHPYLNTTHWLLTGFLPVVWVFAHAVTHITTCHTSEHMRSNMWIDIILHSLSAYITLLSYMHYYYLHQLAPSPKPVHNQFLALFKWSITYLTVIAIWCFLSCYISYVHVKSPEDGDRFFPWWIGSGLSFINFSTVNVYNQPLFSQRFLVELLGGVFVFVTQVTNIIGTSSYVASRYFETYLFGAFFCQQYFDFHALSSNLPRTKYKTLERIDANSEVVVNSRATTQLRVLAQYTSVINGE